MSQDGSKDSLPLPSSTYASSYSTIYCPNPFAMYFYCWPNFQLRKTGKKSQIDYENKV
jgi:hypothetical protein